MINVFKLFAKTEPFVSLYDHCVQAGKAAGVLWDLGVVNNKIIDRNSVCLLTALHDVGKCHPNFQRKGVGIIPYCDELMQNGYLLYNEKEYRHEIGTEKIILNNKQRFVNNETAKAIAKILRLHHQKSDSYTDPSPKQSDWIASQNALVEELEKGFGIKLSDISFQVGDAVCTMLWGLVILADWLVSGGLYDGIEFLFEKRKAPSKSISQLFELSSLRPLQEQCEVFAKRFQNNVPYVIIIEAPMGEGKTEAALYLASQILSLTDKSGFYVALPTMATARQMESRVSDLLSKNGIGKARLVHSEAWLEQEIKQSEEIDKSWFAPTKRSLLSNYAVGTVDQAMMSVLRIKQGVLRLLGLNNKVLIIDEVHAYDTYMQTIIFRLLEWCAALDVPVIMLSATLPRKLKEKLLSAYGGKSERLSQAYPLITSIGQGGGVCEIPVEGSYINKKITWENVIYKDSLDTAKRAISAIKDGGCACVIMNTVKDAQEVYAAAKSLADNETSVILFHSKFLAKDRKNIEERCIRTFGKEEGNRPKKALLVATQVVEQSLDVDFDYMISALAPVDLLLQRAGRLHRHNRARPQGVKNPKFTVLINGEDVKDYGIERVYNSLISEQTQKSISKINKVKIPEDIRPLIEEVYGKIPEPNEAGYEDWVRLRSEQAVMEGKAKNVVFPAPSPDHFSPMGSGDYFDETDNNLLCSDAVTRLGGNNARIALLPSCLWDPDSLTNPDKDHAAKVMNCSVSVGIKNFCTLITDSLFACGGYLRGIYAIKGENEFTLQFSKNGQPITTNYSIDEEYGLRRYDD